MIIGWWCEAERRVVPLDHFEKTGFDHTPMPVLMLRDVLAEENDPEVAHHKGPNISPSVLKACPRETLITRFLDFAPDPKGYNNIYFGKAVHEKLEKVVDPDWWNEFRLPPVKSKFVGEWQDSFDGLGPPTVLGVPMYGVVDRLQKDFLELEDYKTQSEFGYGYHIKNELGCAKPDDAAQLNIYRLMLQELFDKSPDVMRIYYGAQCSWGKDPWDLVDVPIMGEDEILAVRPGGGNFSMGQILELVKVAFEDIQELFCTTPKNHGGTVEDRVRELVHHLPMVGITQFNGSKCYKYCHCPRECAEISTPEGDMPPTGPASRGKKATRKPPNPFLAGIDDGKNFGRNMDKMRDWNNR